VSVVSEHMSQDLLTVSAGDRLGEAAKRMVARGVGAVLVMEGERLEGIPLIVPPPAWCTDNGAMIGAAAAHRFAAGELAGSGLEAIPALALPWQAGS